MSSQPDALTRITDVLKTGLHVEECPDVAALRARTAASGAGFVIAKPLRIGDYYDLQPPVTIYDPGLGTLAFLDRIARDHPDAASLTWKAIEHAAAVRQILIAAAEQCSRESANEVPRTHRLALQVELVLVVSGAAAGDDPVRTTLTDVARRTGYLRLIGLSVIDTERASSLEPASLRRAFAWLLRSTTKWFAGVPQMDDAWRAGGEPLTLALQDYRMAGSRQFVCDSSTWLNLVHGHNGSGKSALAEAVELLLTWRVQRIDDAQETNYFRVLRHRTSGQTDADLANLSGVEVKVYGAGTEPLSTVQIENHQPPARTGRAPRAELQANSFRIDQVFMDKLIRSRAAERAALFLNAFSPGDAALLANLQRLRAEVRKAWHPLPEHVRRKAELQHAAAGTMSAPEATPPPPPVDGQISSSSLSEEKMAEVILRELGPLQGLLPDADPAAKGAAIPAVAIETLLPGERKELAPLASRFPGFMERVDALLKANTTTELRAEFGVFQSALQSFRSTASNGLGDLSGALRVFQEYRSWNATGRVAGGQDFEADLRRWLDLQALVDLTTKYGDVVTTLDNAHRAGWQPDAADRKVLRLDAPLSGPARQELSERRTKLIDELSTCRDRLATRTDAPPRSAGETPTVPEPVRRPLSDPEVQGLNRAGELLVSTRGPELLGVRFVRALRKDQEQPLLKGVIGRAGGLDEAIEEASALRRAFQLITMAGPPPGLGSGVDPLVRIENALRAARAFTEESNKLPNSFFSRLAGGNTEELNSLLAAFNELLALTTPARWAYRDIHLNPTMPNGDPALGFQTAEGAPAELLFNTAELNSAALVLFLLLAPRLPNDLRLMILDDPLQNMDELTVVTLARALAKLRIIYPKGWTLLAFFHGEQHIKHIREEAPSQVYRLPWLQSSASGAKETIRSVPAENTAPSEWQALSDVMPEEAVIPTTSSSISSAAAT